MRKQLLAAALLAGLLAAAGPALAANEREVTANYVAGTGTAPVALCAIVGASQTSVNGVCLDVQDGEETVDLAIHDEAAPVTEPVCGHYAVRDADGNLLAHDDFASETSVTLPTGADRIRVLVGDSHGPGIVGLGLTDCPDQRGTVGEVQAVFR